MLTLLVYAMYNAIRLAWEVGLELVSCTSLHDFFCEHIQNPKYAELAQMMKVSVWKNLLLKQVLRVSC